MIPQGSEVLVASALRSASPLAWSPRGAEALLRCDDFRIDVRPDGSIRQFYSDVSGGCAAAAAGVVWWCHVVGGRSAGAAGEGQARRGERVAEPAAELVGP